MTLLFAFQSSKAGFFFLVEDHKIGCAIRMSLAYGAGKSQNKLVSDLSIEIIH